MTDPSSGTSEIEDGEQQEPADDCQMLQAGRQFASVFRAAPEPEAVPDHGCRHGEAGQQQGAEPGKEAGGDEASANELRGDGGAGEGRRPRQSVASRPLRRSNANTATYRRRYKETPPRDRAGQSATHIRSSVCAPLCRYQMPDRRRAFRMETIHSVLQHPIGIGHALMLSHVVEPGIDAECLDEDSFF